MTRMFRLGSALLVASLGWGASARGEECTEDTTRPEALGGAIFQADQAVADLDATRLGAAQDLVELAVACRREPVTRQQAFDVHRIGGIHSAVVGGELAAPIWFAAARNIQPGAGLGHAIAGPIQVAWDQAIGQSAPERAELVEPREGSIYVDGTEGLAYPAYLPFVFQYVVEGAVVHSQIQHPGEPLPEYPVHRSALVEERGRAWSRAWLAGAVLSGAVSAGTLVAAGGIRQRYLEPEVSYEDGQRMVGANRALGGLGLGFGVTAAGLATVAVVEGQW